MNNNNELTKNRFVSLVFAGIVLYLSVQNTEARQDIDNTGTLQAATGLMALPDDNTLENNHARIGKIRIRRKNVFDPNNPDENLSIYRFANKVHQVTRKSVIRRQLLFESGSLYSRRLLTESERILRNNSYIYDAWIRPVRYEQNLVDIEVLTQDTWTLTGSLSFNREGGKNEYGAEMVESNLLGYGKHMRVRHDVTVDRTRTLFQYIDKQLLNSRNQLTLEYNDNSDGITRRIKLNQPFFSLDSRWSLGLTASTEDRVDALYDEGEITQEFAHDERLLEFSGGLSSGYTDQQVYRWKLGLRKTIDKFAALEQNDTPVTPPNDRTFTYPWIALQYLEDKIIKTKHITQINRTEDINLGTEVDIELGWSHQELGAKDEAKLFDIKTKHTFQPTKTHLLRLTSFLKGRHNNSDLANTRAGFSSKYYWPNFDRQIFYLGLSAEYAKNLDRNQQLLLGGDSGLRGYPLRFQNGDRKFLLSLEQRYYTTWHWWQLIYVGAVAFVDIGRAWFPHQSDTPNTRPLKDIGFGLRFASSRSAQRAILHIDIAFPLDGDDNLDDVQFVLITRETF